jgi:hypothetical protein
MELGNVVKFQKIDAGETTIPVIAKWFEADAAKRLLTEIAGCDPEDRPTAYRCSDRYRMGPKEWIEFDREDPRVIALGAMRDGYLEMAMHLSLLVEAAYEVEVDEAISVAIARWDVKFAQDDEYRLLLDAGLSIGEARARAYGEARA